MKLAQAVGKRTKKLHGKTSDIKFSTMYLISDALNITIQEFLNSPLFNMDNLEI